MAKIIPAADVTKAEIHPSQRSRTSAIIIITLILAFYVVILDVIWFVFFALLCIYLLAGVLFAGFRVDDEGVRKLEIWRRNTLVRWDEIERVSEIRTADRWGAYWLTMNNGKRKYQDFTTHDRNGGIRNSCQKASSRREVYDGVQRIILNCAT